MHTNNVRTTAASCKRRAAGDPGAVGRQTNPTCIYQLHTCELATICDDLDAKSRTTVVRPLEPPCVRRRCVGPSMHHLLLLVAIAQQLAAAVGYDATVSMDVSIRPSYVMASWSATLQGYLASYLTTHYSPPSDVVITAESLHATVPGTFRVIASTSSPSSAAIMLQDFALMTEANATSLLRDALSPFNAMAAYLWVPNGGVSSPLVDAPPWPPAPP